MDGMEYPVILSDEQEALSAAQAAGRASVGLVTRDRCADMEGSGDVWLNADYVAEVLQTCFGKLLRAAEYVMPEAEESQGFLSEDQILAEAGIDDRYLERVLRRHLGLPWIICETERLLIREFTLADAELIPREPEDTDADAVFYTPELLDAYIRNQYRFCEHGIWAVVRKEDGVIVGMAGVTASATAGDCSAGGGCETDSAALELGYHIFAPYRRRGYAEEACRAVLDWARQELDCPVYAKVKPDNLPSVRLLKKLGISYIWAEAELPGTAAPKLSDADVKI